MAKPARKRARDPQGDVERVLVFPRMDEERAERTTDLIEDTVEALKRVSIPADTARSILRNGGVILVPRHVMYCLATAAFVFNAGCTTCRRSQRRSFRAT